MDRNITRNLTLAPPPPGNPQARQVSLLRLLLLALSLAVLVFTVVGNQGELAPDTIDLVRWLLVGVGLISGLLILLVSWARQSWQLVLHLVFDLLWIGCLVYLTGGAASPAVVLFFAVVLIANLVLPGVAPFVMPALASLVVSGIAALYLADITPFPSAHLSAHPALIETHRILAHLAFQVAGLFVVDLLGQLLARRLREQRLFTSQLLDQLGEGVLAVDRNGTVTYLNDEARRLLTLSHSGLVGQQATVVLASRRLQPALALLRQEDVPATDRIETDDGHSLLLRVNALAGRGSKGLGRTLLVADETRLRLLEENARRAEHLASLGEMAAGIAHEVRNPLTSLRGCAQELSELLSQSSNPDAHALCGIMLTEADRLARIVSDFLTLSRLRPPRIEIIATGEVMAECEQLLRKRDDLPLRLEFTVSEEPGSPRLRADHDQLQQVLMNLLLNALDAVRTVQMPRITCRAESAESGNPLGMSAVVLRISDNGIGIPAELQERVFTPFFSTKAQGTGLGLSLVSRIIREHEGVLRLTSAPGSGTTVAIYLPAHSQTREFKRAVAAG